MKTVMATTTLFTSISLLSKCANPLAPRPTRWRTPTPPPEPPPAQYQSPIFIDPISEYHQELLHQALASGAILPMSKRSVNEQEFPPPAFLGSRHSALEEERRRGRRLLVSHGEWARERGMERLELESETMGRRRLQVREAGRVPDTEGQAPDYLRTEHAYENHDFDEQESGPVEEERWEKRKPKLQIPMPEKWQPEVEEDDGEDGCVLSPGTQRMLLKFWAQDEGSSDANAAFQHDGAPHRDTASTNARGRPRSPPPPEISKRDSDSLFDLLIETTEAGKDDGIEIGN